MAFELNEKDKAVYEYLNSTGTKYSVYYKGGYSEGAKGEGWPHDKWEVVFTEGALSESFEYSTGIGHRIEARKGSFSPPVSDVRQIKLHRESTPSLAAAKLLHPTGATGRNNAWAVAPTAASVLCCLLNDGRAIDTSFDYWCTDYDYDPDSRKAFKTYEACCEIGKKLKRIFTAAQREKLEELLQDY